MIRASFPKVENKTDKFLRSLDPRCRNGRTIVVIHRELPVTVLASVLGARRGQSLPAHFAVHPRPEPRLHVTAARCTVFTTATGTLLLAPAVDEAAQRRGERRLHPATSNTQAREETVEKGDERGESTIPPRERGRGERERKRYRVSVLAATTCPEAKRLYSRARAKGRQTTGEGGSGCCPFAKRSSERGEERLLRRRVSEN